MNDEARDNLGQTIDRLDSVIGALELPLGAEMHVRQVKVILPDISADLKRYYVELFGENPWE